VDFPPGKKGINISLGVGKKGEVRRGRLQKETPTEKKKTSINKGQTSRKAQKEQRQREEGFRRQGKRRNLISPEKTTPEPGGEEVWDSQDNNPDTGETRGDLNGPRQKRLTFMEKKCEKKERVTTLSP